MTDRVYLGAYLGLISATATFSVGVIPSGMTGIHVKSVRITSGGGNATHDDSLNYTIALKTKTGNKTLATVTTDPLTAVGGAFPGALAAGVAKDVTLGLNLSVPSGETLQMVFTKNTTPDNMTDFRVDIEGSPY